MAAAGRVEVDAKQMAGNLTIQVQLRRAVQWRWRIWIGTKLIRLASWVMWVNVEMKEVD